MKNTLVVTYTKKHSISLEETSQSDIAQAIYNAFINELGDYVDDCDVDTVPGDALKRIFTNISESMVNDDEFWGD